MKSRKKLILIPIAAVMVIIITMLTIIFIRPNLTISDLKEPNKVQAIFKYGIPTRTNNDNWIYENNIKFYGNSVLNFSVDFEDKCIKIMPGDDEAENEIWARLDSAASLEYTDTIFHARHYRYKNITFDDTFESFIVLRFD